MVRRGVAVAVLLGLVAVGVVLTAGGHSTERASAASGARAAHAPRSAKGSRRGAAIVNLARGSDPSVLPGPVLIADRDNNRLIEVSPTGRLIWAFPRPGDLARGQTFTLPDDVFFSSSRQQAMVTQEDDFVISVIALATTGSSTATAIPACLAPVRATSTTPTTRC